MLGVEVRTTAIMMVRVWIDDGRLVARATFTIIMMILRALEYNPNHRSGVGSGLGLYNG